jgi:DNA-binding protein H-NS
MATYKQLKDQIEELQRQAEEARAQEVNGAVNQIKTLMQDYGITISDLDGAGRKKSSKSGQQSNVQFQDESGNTWSGRGRMPAWLKGKDKEQFRVK